MTRTRSAFTLIELLVVIAIISILAALTGAAVQKVRERGREVQCRNDLTQLETAIGQFKAEFGVYPPCFGSGPGGTFKLSTMYFPGDPELAMLQQIRNRISPGDNGLRQLDPTGAPTAVTLSNLGTDGIPRDNPVLLDPNQALVFFLSGGVFTGYTGFSTNPQTPFSAPPTSGSVSSRLKNGAFYEFPQSRMLLRTEFKEKYFANGGGLRFVGDTINPRREQPWFTDPWGSPYLYFCSRLGNDYPFANTRTDGTFGLKVGPWGGRYSPFGPDGDPIDVNPNIEGRGTEPFCTGSVTGNVITNQKFINLKTYQIISAGRDKKFGPGYSDQGMIYFAGQSFYAVNRLGGDDFANFQPTPLSVGD